MLIGLLRDLGGILQSTFNKNSFECLFEWLYPKCFRILLKVVTAYYNYAPVLGPLLQFLKTISNNTSARLSFEVSSPNGIILFKEVSQILIAFRELLSFHLFCDHHPKI